MTTQGKSGEESEVLHKIKGETKLCMESKVGVTLTTRPEGAATLSMKQKCGMRYTVK